jgi:uncharacterized protein with GYD domain
MATYIGLAKWTTEGLQSIKESPSRLNAARKAFKAAGLKLTDFYMLMGQYDMLIIVEAPDDAAIAKAILTLGAAGKLQTQTFRAFTEAEYREVISGLE